MGLLLFKISILLIVIGASGTGIIFVDSSKLDQKMTLSQSEIDQISLFFEAGDIGYHTIIIPEFEGQGVFFRIVDPEFETISKGLIQTKMSIGYFDTKASGMYTMVLTNLAQKEMNYEVKIGSTAAEKIIIPAGIMFAGGLLLLFASYKRLKNYRIEQPDENIR